MQHAENQPATSTALVQVYEPQEEVACPLCGERSNEVVFHAREHVEMPPPGSLEPARFAVSLRDLVWDAFYAPVAASVSFAAERLNITASAVNRRIMDLEEELGAELFERRPRGVRLTAAGEMFLHYVRAQSADVERMRSQIEDLKGLRRGAVRIACSQALAPDFLPAQIADYRARYPQVAFEVSVLDHERAMAALAAYDVDLVLVFRPPYLATFQPLMKLEQRLVALMSATHPLASRRTVRLRYCVSHPVALPERSIGGRQLLDEVTSRNGMRFNVVAESNSF